MVAAAPFHDKWTQQQRAATAAAISVADSPAEARLAVELFAHGWPDGYAFGPPGSGAEWEIVPQVEIATGERTYRVDFAARRGDLKVAVEVDGFAYHRSTEEQEAYDACRDYALSLNGWHTIRVTAGNVWRCPADACASVATALNQIVIRSKPPAALSSPNQDLIDALSDDISQSEQERILLEVVKRRRARLGIGPVE